MKSKDKHKLYSGIVWLIAAVALAIYGTILFFNSNIPGAPELISFLNSIDSKYIYIIAFVSVFIEGLYFIGSFFPGAGLVLVTAILSGAMGYVIFLYTVFFIFIGWSLAGIINILFALFYRNKIKIIAESTEYVVNDCLWATWFPSFRSNYEVSQIIEGGSLSKVLGSAIRVRIYATVFASFLAICLPFLFNVNNVSDKDGYLVIITIFIINLVIGLKKIRQYSRG